MPSLYRTRSRASFIVTLLLLLLGAIVIAENESLAEEAAESEVKEDKSNGRARGKLTAPGQLKDKDKKKDPPPPPPPPPTDGPLTVRHALTSPTRVTQGPAGKIYVTDTRIGSVFIFESDLTLSGELKGLAVPLGIAVNNAGDMIVGCNGSDTIEVYDATGTKIRTVSSTTAHPIQMPSDLALDRNDNLYIADSRRNLVEVYDSAGVWVRTIGEPNTLYTGLSFPSAVTVAYRTVDGVETGELYVADQGGVQIQVFSLDGTLLRNFGTAIGEFSTDWQGKFTRLQSLAMDGQDRLHVLDCYLRRVQLVDPVTGGYLGAYAAYPPDDKRLKLALDLILTSDGRAIVTDATTKSLEVFPTWPQTEPE